MYVAKCRGLKLFEIISLTSYDLSCTLTCFIKLSLGASIERDSRLHTHYPHFLNTIFYNHTTEPTTGLFVLNGIFQKILQRLMVFVYSEFHTIQVVLFLQGVVDGMRFLFNN